MLELELFVDVLRDVADAFELEEWTTEAADCVAFASAEVAGVKNVSVAKKDDIAAGVVESKPVKEG